MHDPARPPQTEFRVTLTYLVLCLLCLGLVCFFSFHTYLLMFNYTTIEFLEKRGCNPPKDHINRYNLGVWGNVTAVLGSNMLVWLLPVRWTCEGDGLSFKVRHPRARWLDPWPGGRKPLIADATCHRVPSPAQSRMVSDQ